MNYGDVCTSIFDFDQQYELEDQLTQLNKAGSDHVFLAGASGVNSGKCVSSGNRTWGHSNPQVGEFVPLGI